MQPNHSTQGIPPIYTHPDRFPSGARCRACSRIYGQDQFDNVRFCRDHDERNNSEEARLCHLSVDLQELFLARCSSYRDIMGWRPAYKLWEPQNAPVRSPSETQWWKWVVQSYRMCEISHHNLAQPLLDCKEGRRFEEYNLKILAMYKVRFVTISPHDIWHCAFIIALNSGMYVFDPTGVQFGPDWPLVSEWGTYRSMRMKPDESQWNLEIVTLSSNTCHV
ncbi:hypothetical protein BKA66DRAFT_572206 [Pyrenochaeta sp. MPI-SDFR-AT-0127]|nr:hypothetical protein BKA66DRAFT_572206 [Pyrenochaeta sp. MPI-SDFR-AT-0127]